MHAYHHRAIDKLTQAKQEQPMKARLLEASSPESDPWVYASLAEVNIPIVCTYYFFMKTMYMVEKYVVYRIV